VIGFAFTFVLAKKSWQTGVGVVCGGIFILSLLLVTANFVSHFGMKKVVETQSIELVSSADGLDVLLYQPLGDGSEKVYLYQTPDTKEPKPTDTDYVTNTVTKVIGNMKMIFINYFSELSIIIMNLSKQRTPLTFLKLGKC
jgi:hypothetical protein